MSKKNITLGALVFSVIALALSILHYAGVILPDMKIGWYNEYGENSATMINSAYTWFHTPFYIIYSIFVIAFLWGIKKAGNAIVGNIAIILWILWTFVDSVSLFASFSAIIGGEGDSLYQSTDYWYSEGASKYPIIWFYLENVRLLHTTLLPITGLLAHLIFIPSFIAVMKQNREVGILGIITMLLYFTAFIPLPYIYLLETISWIPLLWISWRWYSQRS